MPVIRLVPDHAACDWCESKPGERHAPQCPEAEDGGPLQLCYGCGVHYLTACLCDEGEDR